MKIEELNGTQTAHRASTKNNSKNGESKSGVTSTVLLNPQMSAIDTPTERGNRTSTMREIFSLQ